MKKKIKPVPKFFIKYISSPPLFPWKIFLTFKKARKYDQGSLNHESQDFERRPKGKFSGKTFNLAGIDKVIFINATCRAGRHHRTRNDLRQLNKAGGAINLRLPLIPRILTHTPNKFNDNIGQALHHKLFKSCGWFKFRCCGMFRTIKFFSFICFIHKKTIYLNLQITS